MPARTPTNCHAEPAKFDGQLIYLVTVSTGEQFFVKQTGAELWCAWVSLQAMREGDGRVYCHAEARFDLIAFLDAPDSEARAELFARAKAKDMADRRMAA